jgi:hypothetical protein
MNSTLDPRRFTEPLWMVERDFAPPSSASDLYVGRCPIQQARELNALWHSRLPHAQRSPWCAAFAASYCGYIYAVALWHNPSSRSLPHHWAELRRMAVAPDAPHCTASMFLAAMVRWYRTNEPEHERLISYQDTEVHRGTIYKAAGWTAAHYQKPRLRDRTALRRGTNRLYRRADINPAAEGSGKVRWEKLL